VKQDARNFLLPARNTKALLRVCKREVFQRSPESATQSAKPGQKIRTNGCKSWTIKTFIGVRSASMAAICTAP
jgi:hypothetical protein